MDFTQEYRIRSMWTVQTTAGEPFAVVRVRNLQAAVQGPHDAWGRASKAQPLLVSAEVSLAEPFATASATDQVTSDTVHYGTLSKAILSALTPFAPEQVATKGPPAAFELNRGATTLTDVLGKIWYGLTGRKLDGIVPSRCGPGAPFLDISKLRSLSVSLLLPKASLLGDGVGLAAMSVFEPNKSGTTVAMFAVSLLIRNLRMPVLIGVNSNERQSKQVVVATVEIDKFDYGPDVYTDLESFIVKVLGETSFETLEALGAHLAHRIVTEFRPLPGQTYSGYFGWQVKISLEKPTAVPFADAPAVQIRVGGGVPPRPPPPVLDEKPATRPPARPTSPGGV